VFPQWNLDKSVFGVGCTRPGRPFLSCRTRNFFAIAERENSRIVATTGGYQESGVAPSGVARDTVYSERVEQRRCSAPARTTYNSGGA